MVQRGQKAPSDAASHAPPLARALRAPGRVKVLVVGALVVVAALSTLALVRPWDAEEDLSPVADAQQTQQGTATAEANSVAETATPGAPAAVPPGTDPTAASGVAAPVTAAGAGDAQGAGSAGKPTPPGPRLQPPATAPAAPDDPVGMLDETFGEALFPARYPELKRESVFSIDDEEATGTYKNTGAAPFELIRITVQRGGSAADAGSLLAVTRELFPARLGGQEWGGRRIERRTDSEAGPSASSPLNYSWTQKRYAIDVTIYPPYPSGVEAAQDGALEFIGRLQY